MAETPGTAGYYPFSLDLHGRPCLVVGGGPVAARKAQGLLDGGAVVTVIAPDISPAMAALSPLAIERRPYAAGDATLFRLVITATGRPEIDGAVYAEAEAAGIWVNSADDRDHCSFILPSVHRDGAVTFAVSTGGLSPALASWLRQRLAEQFGTGAGTLAELLGRARSTLQAAGASTEDFDWARLLDGPLPVLVGEGRIDEAVALIDQALGSR
jgi:precorrin-2 dehydrogenase / sirohydrochlorin ferrochelatase